MANPTSVASRIAPATMAITMTLSLSACASAPQPQPQAAATSSTATYPAMAPMEQYRVSPASDEVALARSAAPASVADHADVLVLGEHGYTLAEKGSNGFVCIVQRSWANNFDSDQFWNPKIRSPNCFNEAAARSVVPAYLKRTEWVLAGASKADVMERTKSAIASKEIGAPEVGSMCFMMSKRGYLNDEVGPWHPHVMFFLPRTSPAEWGANLPESPLFADDGALEPYTIFMSPVRHWSDGTPDTRN